jgi:hypothetical protein
MVKAGEYKYLARRDASRYQQLFYRGRQLRAETLFRQTIGVDPRTPQQVAEDYDIPVDAVLEAIHYCTHNEELLRLEREQDLADLRARGLLASAPAPRDGVATP